MKASRFNRKWYFAAGLCVFIIGLLLYFSYKNFISEEDQKTRYKITIITKSTQSDFFKSVFSGANAAAAEYNADIITEGPGGEEDYETQNKMIRDAVEEGTDAIVLSAVDYNKNAEAVNEAASAGIPVVIIDSDVNSAQVSCRIGTDNYAAGVMAAEALEEATDDESYYVGIVNFDKNTENGQQRESGFRDGLEGNERVKSITTVNVISTPEDACRGTKELLSLHPEINALVTFNEWTSLGVGQAVKDLGIKDSVSLTAFDSNEICVNMLEEGVVDALIVQNPYAMGYLGVENACRLIENRSVVQEKVDIETTIVTRENMFLPEYQRILFKYE